MSNDDMWTIRNEQNVRCTCQCVWTTKPTTPSFLFFRLFAHAIDKQTLARVEQSPGREQFSIMEFVTKL